MLKLRVASIDCKQNRLYEIKIICQEKMILNEMVLQSNGIPYSGILKTNPVTKITSNFVLLFSSF